MLIRGAKPEDAKGLSAFLQELSALGKRTMPSDEDYVSNNLHSASRLHRVHSRAGPRRHFAWPANPETRQHRQYLRGHTGLGHNRNPRQPPSRSARCYGKALFASTKAAAINAKLQKIDATIGDTIPEGLAYYEAMGFRSYKSENGKTSKCYVVST